LIRRDTADPEEDAEPARLDSVIADQAILQSLDPDRKNLTPGAYDVTCDIPGHKDHGMTSKLNVA
jgi:hypothetical protein